MNKKDKGSPRELGFIADSTLRDITTQQGALSRKIRLSTLAASSKTQILLRTYLYYYGGYALHGRAVLFGLGEYPEFIVGALPFHTPVDVDFYTESKIEFYKKQAQFLIDKNNAIHLNIACPAHATAYPHEKCKKSIMWTMGEHRPLTLDKKPGSYIGPWLDRVDEIWVPTFLDMERFCKITNPDKMRIAYLGVQNELFHPDVSPLEIVNTKDKFVFLVDATWSPRKGIDYIIEAYSKTFTKKEPVVLMLMCKYGTRPYGAAYSICSRMWKALRKHRRLWSLPGIKEIEYYGNSKWSILNEFSLMLKEKNLDPDTMPEICLLDIPVHENIMPNFYASAHCIVGASLGESTWLPGIQALAMGLPIIQMRENWGGCGEYCPSDYPLLYGSDGEIRANDRLWKGTSIYYKDQNFPRPDVRALGDRMRHVYEYYEPCVKMTKHISEHIQNNWGWDKRVNDVAKLLGAN